MKKNKILIIEIIIWLLIIVLIGLYINILISEIKGYDVTQGMGLDLIILIHTIIFIIFLILFTVLFSFIYKYQKRNDINGIFNNTFKFIKSHRLLSISIFFISFIFIFLFITIAIQDSLLYYPNHSYGTEEILNDLGSYEKIHINSEDGKNYSGWGKIDDNLEYTIVYFGGNAQSSAVFFAEQNFLEWQKLKNYNVIMVDYPGYGISSGTPNEEDIYDMALTVFDYVYNLERIDNTKIIVMGFSLGSGVATYVAQNRDFHKLILIAPYSSMIDVFNSKLPVFYGPFKSLLKNEFNSSLRAEEITEDSLIIYSNSDDVIPPKLSSKLVNAFNKSQVYIIDGLNHNEILSDPEVQELIYSFIK